jgi:hypothetical protein
MDSVGSRSFNQSGFVTLEAMVAAGIFVMVAAGAASVFTTQFKMSAQLNDKFEILDMKRNVSQLLGDADQCHFNFAGKTLSQIVDKAPLTSLQYFDMTGHPLDSTLPMQAGGKISPTARLKVSSIYLDNVESISPLKKKADVVVTFEDEQRSFPFAPAVFQNVIFSANAALLISHGGNSSVTTVATLVGQVCPQGYYVNGIDVNGQVMCNVLPGSTNSITTNTIAAGGSNTNTNTNTNNGVGYGASNTFTNSGTISISSTARSVGGNASAATTGITQIAASSSGSASNTFTNSGTISISATASSVGGTASASATGIRQVASSSGGSASSTLSSASLAGH